MPNSSSTLTKPRAINPEQQPGVTNLQPTWRNQNQQANLSSGASYPSRSVTSNTTASTSDSTVGLDTTDLAVTYTLPPASITPPMKVTVKWLKGTNAATIVPQKTDTIDGLSSITLSAVGNSITLLSVGNNANTRNQWWIQDNQAPTFTGVSSIAATGHAALTGAVTLSAGAGIALTEAGQNIAIAATTPSVTPFNAGTAGAALTIDFNNGINQYFTLQATVTTVITFANITSGQLYTLEAIQPVSGSALITWPGSVRFGSIVSTLNTSQEADIFQFYYNANGHFVCTVHNEPYAW